MTMPPAHCGARSKARRFWLGCAAFSFATLLMGARWARAYAEGAAREGLSLLEEVGPSLVGSPQGFELNGERIWLASKVTPLQVREILDAVEGACDRRSRDSLSEFGGLPSALRRLLPAPREVFSARVSGNFGQLVCFANRGEHAPRLAERAREFLEGGNLAALGRARYVAAARDEKADRTHVLTVWTEGSFNLRSLFPFSGDSPGADSSVVSRPAKSVRLLSARRIGGGDAIRLYKTSASASSVLDGYTRELAQKGFIIAALPSTRGARALEQTSRAFFKGEASVIVSARDGFVSGTVVAIVESESVGRASVPGEAP